MKVASETVKLLVCCGPAADYCELSTYIHIAIMINWDVVTTTHILYTYTLYTYVCYLLYHY